MWFWSSLPLVTSLRVVVKYISGLSPGPGRVYPAKWPGRVFPGFSCPKKRPGPAKIFAGHFAGYFWPRQIFAGHFAGYFMPGENFHRAFRRVFYARWNFSPGISPGILYPAKILKKIDQIFSHFKNGGAFRQIFSSIWKNDRAFHLIF